MTKKEAICGVKTWHYRMRDTHIHNEFALEFVDCAVFLANESEKYKWHDLRVNTKDLPEIELTQYKLSKPVLTVTDDHCFRIALYNYDSNEWWNFSTMKEIDSEIIYWKYEPFEEIQL